MELYRSKASGKFSLTYIVRKFSLKIVVWLALRFVVLVNHVKEHLVLPRKNVKNLFLQLTFFFNFLFQLQKSKVSSFPLIFMVVHISIKRMNGDNDM